MGTPHLLRALRAAGWHHYSLFVRDDGLLVGCVDATNLAAAQGQYDFWFEATDVFSPTLAGNGLALANYLEGKMQTIATAPHVVSILAIPGAGGNAAGLPAATANGSPTIYVNPFTRLGVSCSTPLSGL